MRHGRAVEVRTEPGGDGSNVREDTTRILTENLHIKFFNNQRGYVRCNLTPERWLTDFRVVPYVSQPGSQVFTRASFVVEAGNPGLQPTEANSFPTAQEVAQAAEADRAAAQEEAGRRGR